MSLEPSKLTISLMSAEVTEIEYSDFFTVMAFRLEMTAAVGIERIDIPAAVWTMQFPFC